MKSWNLEKMILSLRLQQIYILVFVAVGLNILRPSIFNQTSNIWNSSIPEPDKVLVILDAIEYARLEQDFVKYVSVTPEKSSSIWC